MSTLPRRGQVGLQFVEDNHVAQLEFRHQHLIHVPPHVRGVTAQENVRGAFIPSKPTAAIVLFELHEPGIDPSARSPRGTRAWLRVMDVFTLVSSKNTSRFG